MTDREMLELAAKAAGVDGQYFHSDNPIHTGIACAWAYEKYWNPLIDDGEALRLAVKLGIALTFVGGVLVIAGDPSTPHMDQRDYGNDLCAATRRAIVRAAAEIGNEMP